MASQSDQSMNEYIVRVPKNSHKKYNVMRFKTADQMDIQKWKKAHLFRNLSAKTIYQEEEVFPEFGAGSEYGRKQREEARKLKYGMRKSKFKVDDQPWKLTVNMTAKAPYSAKTKDKDKEIAVTKEFDGRKEGGIGEGSMYFIFMQRPDHTFEAYPVEAWYNFTRTIKHRTLTDEEAEAEWDKRDKIVNHLNFMARKRLQLEDEEEEEEKDKKGSKKATKKDVGKKSDKSAGNGLLIHDEDQLIMSDSQSSSDEDQPKKVKKKSKKKKKEDDDAPEEGLEESDDGDGEGQEQDYNSDISSDEEIANDSRIAPKDLNELESSSSSEEEDAKPEDNEKEGGEKKKSKKKKKDEGDDNSSTSGDSDDESDIEKEGSALFMNKRKTPTKSKKGSSSNNSRSSTPNSELLSGAVTKNKLQEVAKRLEKSGRESPKLGLLGKRSATSEAVDSSSNKKQKVGGGNSGSNTPTRDLTQSQNVIAEETVRRYLQHKPITTKDLLKKFKTKRTGLTSEQIVTTVAKILKRLNPEQKKINGKIHLFLKQS